MQKPGGRGVVHAAAALLAVASVGALAPGAALARPARARAAGTAGVTGRIAYVTSSEAQPEPRIWTALGTGAEPKLLGPGDEPSMAPNGATVAAGLLGAGSARGPSLALYPTVGGSPATFGNLKTASALPLAWSPDSRYLAVELFSTAIKNVGRKSGLAIVDTSTGKLRTIATGIIYGASFAPDGSDRIVFGRATGQNLESKVNLYIAAAGGGSLKQITSDGRSLNPVWGPRFIAYDRERLRRNDAPVYQIWLRAPRAGGARQLTSIRVRSLVSGLTPLGFSADGSRLLAEFGGQDTSEAWTVQVPSGRARRVTVKGQPVVAGAISRDGSRLLVFEGGFEGPAQPDNVVTVPATGGAPTLLVAHANQPTWNE
jgi:dipeptidyl aminopeptidase/acylaminoacyl peptidase